LARFGSLALLAALSAFSLTAAAKRTGQNMECPTCHEGMDGPKITVALEPSVAAPGQTVKLKVTAEHDMALVGGVFVDSLGGELKVVPDTKTWLIAPNQGTHSEPHPYLNGQVEFEFDWVAPAAPGTTRFEVWSNAANDNKMQADDSPAHARAFIAYGCSGVWYYPDADLDGYGDEAKRELSCTPIAGLMTQGGDCNDATTLVNAGIVETCNNIDDDCDGAIDNGFMPGKLWVDQDGDGFGALGGQMTMGCPPVAGYAPTTGDCDDARPEINPKIVEQPNGIDDNCDSQVDEKPSMTTGGTSAGGAATGGGAGTPSPAPTTAPAAGGCQLGGASGSTGSSAMLLLLLAGAGRRGRGRHAR
jgi:hypothetical protein